MFQIQVLVKDAVALEMIWAKGSRHKLKHRKLCPNTRKQFFTVMVVKHRQKLSREVV